MEMPDDKKQVIAALVKVQATMETAKKTSTNPFYKSKYADLSTIWDAVRKPLTENGLAVSQWMERLAGDAGWAMVTALYHTSGQCLSGMFPVVPIKDDPQGWGSAQTYARRYGLAALLGVTVADEDDDGNAASRTNGNGAQAQAHAAVAPKAPVPVAPAKAVEEPMPPLKEPAQSPAKFLTGLATEAQVARLEKECKELGVEYDAYLVSEGVELPLTKQQASTLISALAVR